MNSILSALLYPVLFIIGLLVAALPRSVELLLGRFFGRIALVLMRRRAHITYDNIRRCLPALGPVGWKHLVRSNFEHYGALFFEIAHMVSPIPGHYRRYVGRVSRLEGLENWKRAHDKGRGVLFISIHMGNWECMMAQGAMNGIPITVVTRHLKPEWFHKKIEAARYSTGVRATYQPRTMPAVLKSLSRGEAVGFVIDQYAAPPAGVQVPFFGVMVDTLSAVAVLAQRTGAVIVPCHQRRQANGLIRVIIEPELELGEAASDTVQATAILAAKMESWIRDNPSQWLWAHRRFKNVSWPDEKSAGASV
jgi:KDO2-lipid IV(A) lauroyltransferase